MVGLSFISGFSVSNNLFNVLDVEFLMVSDIKSLGFSLRLYLFCVLKENQKVTSATFSFFKLVILEFFIIELKLF